MNESRLVFFVEEASMRACLEELLPRWLPDHVTFQVNAFHDKHDLLKNVGARLAALASWVPDGWKIFVLVDRDDDDCRLLKAELERIVARTGLTTRAAARDEPWKVATRAAFPRVPDVSRKEAFRDPDAVSGGTWEAFERVLLKAGYFKGGLRKLDAARSIGRHMEPVRNRSGSFAALRTAVDEAVRSAS